MRLHKGLKAYCATEGPVICFGAAKALGWPDAKDLDIEIQAGKSPGFVEAVFTNLCDDYGDPYYSISVEGHLYHDAYIVLKCLFRKFGGSFFYKVSAA